MKNCPNCEKTKELSEFYVEKSGRVSSWCKECQIERRKEYEKSTYNEKRKIRWNTDEEYRQKKLAQKRENNANNVERLILTQAKARSRRNNLNFDLELVDIVIPEFCPILEIPILRTGDICSSNSPTLDRIKPELGYIKSNVKVISMLANRMKTNANIEMINKFCKNIKKYMTIDDIV